MQQSHCNRPWQEKSLTNLHSKGFRVPRLWLCARRLHNKSLKPEGGTFPYEMTTDIASGSQQRQHFTFTPGWVTFVYI